MPAYTPLPGTVLSREIADYPEGIVLPIDKPYRWTSADVIRKVKYAAIRHFGKKNLKVGHAGTLDPLATGILIVCIGPATRQAQTLQDHDKEYIAGISFGATTPSYDLEKEIDRTMPYDNVSEASIRAILPSFIGTQQQIAPLFSAKSVDGVRAYDMARRLFKEQQRTGSAANFDSAALDILNTSTITINELELLSFNPDGIPPRTTGPATVASSRIHVNDNSDLHLPHADIRISCSKGTYIRAFARDLGEALGTGAHLDALRRTLNGPFTISDALSLDQVLSMLSSERLPGA
ncbi:MAG: tRNA pseudouridine(55) synthase TruB [Bacteroidales bacterium]|nr:tRNA pseudouridine(55) synthase TruB [Bacteroidales bacterium]